MLAIVYPAGIGMGDVKLAAFLGAWLGRDVAVALFVGTILGRSAGDRRARPSRRRGPQGTLPYVPALAAGAVVGLFFGDALLDAWLG